MELGYQLTGWNRGRSAVVTLDSSTSFRLPDGSVLAPDASWVRRELCEMLTPAERKGFAPVVCKLGIMGGGSCAMTEPAPTTQSAQRREPPHR